MFSDKYWHTVMYSLSYSNLPKYNGNPTGNNLWHARKLPGSFNHQSGIFISAGVHPTLEAICSTCVYERWYIHGGYPEIYWIAAMEVWYYNGIAFALMLAKLLSHPLIRPSISSTFRICGLSCHCVLALLSAIISIHLIMLFSLVLPTLLSTIGWQSCYFWGTANGARGF